MIILLSEGPLTENSANSLTSNKPLSVTVSVPLLVDDMLKFRVISPEIEESIMTPTTMYWDSPLWRVTGSGFVKVIPSESIPTNEIVSFSVPLFVTATLKVSWVPTSRVIIEGKTMESPHSSPTNTENSYDSVTELSSSKTPSILTLHSSVTCVFTPAVTSISIS